MQWIAVRVNGRRTSRMGGSSERLKAGKGPRVFAMAALQSLPRANALLQPVSPARGRRRDFDDAVVREMVISRVHQSAGEVSSEAFSVRLDSLSSKSAAARGNGMAQRNRSGGEARAVCRERGFSYVSPRSRTNPRLTNIDFLARPAAGRHRGLTIHESTSKACRHWAGGIGICSVQSPRGARQDDGWVSLFDGTTLSGWTKAGGRSEDSKWEVVDGAIVGHRPGIDAL